MMETLGRFINDSQKLTKKISFVPRFVENVRGLDDSRLLDAAETLVTLQTSGMEFMFIEVIDLLSFFQTSDLAPIIHFSLQTLVTYFPRFNN